MLPGSKKVIEAPLCNLTDVCYPSAATSLSETPSIWTKFCSSCQQSCSTIDFSVTPSSVAAPSFQYAYAAKSFVESRNITLPTNWATNWLTEVQNNFVGIDVVCESLLVENLTQQPSMTGVDVISNVGGQTGLWIGISFLSIMEIVEMLYRLARHQWSTMCKVMNRKIRPTTK